MSTRQPAPEEVEFFLQLESKVWAALASGDAAADERLLAKDFLGVYSTGFSGRSDHVGRLASGPTVHEYTLSEPKVTVLSKDVVVLSYLATWSRRGADPGAEQELTYISSVWKQREGTWENVFSQDTPAEA
jgi:hypothetical protein